MPEPTEKYKKRLSSYVEGKDPIAMQREAVSMIALLVEGVSEDTLARRPASGKWSITEILAHLAEDELVSTWRYRQMLQYENPTLPGFDQDLWATAGEYAAWKPEEALEMFRLLRSANLRMFEHLTTEQWQRCGVHLERGKLSIRELCSYMAGHDVNHIDQIRRILRR